MKMTRAEYKKYAEAHAPASALFSDCLHAFLVGGLICTVGEGIHRLAEALGVAAEDAGLVTSLVLVAAAVLLTAFGHFDDVAKFAGAGTLVPITGFANAVVSPAIDSKSEGFILGVGAKIFTVAGPVLLYGILSGAAYGVIYYFITLL
jgi:stage V sporulation protein AC